MKKQQSSSLSHQPPQTVLTSGTTTEEPLSLPLALRLLTYKEAAVVLGVCQKTVENLSRVKKEIPVIYIGGSPRIRYGEIVAYLERGGSPPVE